VDVVGKKTRQPLISGVMAKSLRTGDGGARRSRGVGAASVRADSRNTRAAGDRSGPRFASGGPRDRCHFEVQTLFRQLSMKRLAQPESDAALSFDRMGPKLLAHLMYDDVHEL